MLLEREREVAALAATVAEAAAGRARVVLVEGSAGIGKTRLLGEARRLAADAGFRLLVARGGELEREFPFGVVRQLFEPQLVDVEAREQALAGAAGAVRSVFETFGEDDGGTAADPSFASLHGLYTHQGWLAQGGKYFVFNDELDELGGTAPEAKQTTYIVNVESLTNPGTVMASPNNTTSTDHNLYVKDKVIYESNYTSGLRLFDEDTVPSGDLEEIGFFDVYPENDAPGFEGGTWSNYSRYRDDDIVAVSSIDRGLFILETDLDNR